MPASNPSVVTLKIVPTAGTFSGTFNLSNVAFYPPMPTILRSKIPFKGLIFPDAMSQPVGAGFFLLPEMPSMATETIAKTKKNSGLVSLTKVP